MSKNDDNVQFSEADDGIEKIEYTFGITFDKIQTLFENVELSDQKDDLIDNIIKLEQTYTSFLESAKKANELKVEQVSQDHTKKIASQMDKMKKDLELKQKVLDVEVVKNIDKHNALRDEFLTKIEKIYFDSKDVLLNKAISIVAEYLDINLGNGTINGGENKK